MKNKPPKIKEKIMKITQYEKINFLRHLLITNQDLAEFACKKIFAKQTQDEQEDKATKYKNFVGFTLADATFLTACANTLMIQQHVTDEQLPKLFHTIGKYARQLYKNEIVNVEKLDKLIKLYHK